MKIIDYIFFATYTFYENKKDATPALMGCLVLAVLVFASLLSLNMLVEIMFAFRGKVIDKYIIGGFLLLILWLLWRRYRGNEVVFFLRKRYEKLTVTQRRIRACVIVLYAISVILFPIVIGFMRHNSGRNI